MDRASCRYVSLVGLLLLAGAVCAASSGCVNAVAAALYVLRGDDVKAEFDGLKGKRVAVVCRLSPALLYNTPNLDAKLAERVGRLLETHLSRTEVIEQEAVAEWTDENTWDEFTEIGRALKADMVLGIDLEDFTLYQGQTLYQGKADVRLRVYDMADGGRVVYDKIPPRSVFPPNTGIATQEKSEREFLHQYLGVLAAEIARHFHNYDSRAAFALDSHALD